MQDDKNAAYYDYANPYVLQIMPPAAGTVLEIGCGAGRLGEVYKQSFPESRYVGVELNAHAASLAVGRLDKVLSGSAEEIDLGFLAGKVDCLVYADVLEHLTDPWQMLAGHAALLSENGKVIASIPNVQNWSVLKDLIFGLWNYTDEGLMDRTHLRFFTLDGISKLFTGAGLTIEAIAVVNIPHQQPEMLQFVDQLRPALDNFGIDAAVFAERVSAFQYLVSARRS